MQERSGSEGRGEGQLPGADYNQSQIFTSGGFAPSLASDWRRPDPRGPALVAHALSLSSDFVHLFAILSSPSAPGGRWVLCAPFCFAGAVGGPSRSSGSAQRVAPRSFRMCSPAPDCSFFPTLTTSPHRRQWLPLLPDNGDDPISPTPQHESNSSPGLHPLRRHLYCPWNSHWCTMTTLTDIDLDAQAPPRRDLPQARRGSGRGRRRAGVDRRGPRARLLRVMRMEGLQMMARRR